MQNVFQAFKFDQMKGKSAQFNSCSPWNFILIRNKAGD